MKKQIIINREILCENGFCVLIESINFSSIYMLNCILHAYHYFSSKLPRGSYRKVGFDFLFFLSSSTHLICIERIKVLQLKLETNSLCFLLLTLKDKKKLLINQMGDGILVHLSQWNMDGK